MGCRAAVLLALGCVLASGCGDHLDVAARPSGTSSGRATPCPLAAFPPPACADPTEPELVGLWKLVDQSGRDAGDLVLYDGCRVTVFWSPDLPAGRGFRRTWYTAVPENRYGLYRGRGVWSDGTLRLESSVAVIPVFRLPRGSSYPVPAPESMRAVPGRRYRRVESIGELRPTDRRILCEATDL